MTMRLVVIASLLTLAGCAVGARVEARRNYEDAVAAYRACLTAHPGDTNARRRALGWRWRVSELPSADFLAATLAAFFSAFVWRFSALARVTSARVSLLSMCGKSLAPCEGFGAGMDCYQRARGPTGRKRHEG